MPNAASLGSSDSGWPGFAIAYVGPCDDSTAAMKPGSSATEPCRSSRSRIASENLMNAAVREFGWACIDAGAGGAAGERRYWTLVLGAPPRAR